MDAVLFDLEGTLVETLYQRSQVDLAELRAATRKKIVNLGVPDEHLTGIVSGSLLRNIAFEWADIYLSPAEAGRIYTEIDAFMKPFEMNSAILARLYPDTIGTLEKLDSMGVEMGIVTNTSREATEHMLTKFSLGHFFNVVVTRSDSTRLKPNPIMVQLAIAKMEKEIGWLVGDMAFDAEAARGSDLLSIVVRRDGSRPSFNHDYFIDSLYDVETILLERKNGS